MARPQIRPAIFIALQNGLAALLFAILLGAELARRLLGDYPSSETLWWLSSLVNHSVLPLLRLMEQYLTTPDKLLAGLIAGVLIPLLAWWTRYWFATALAGHLTLAALLFMTLPMFRSRGVLSSLGVLDHPSLASPGPAAYALLLLCLFVLVMCIADHVAFIRHLVWLWRKLTGRSASSDPMH